MDTTRPLQQHKSAAQSGASASHDVRSSAAHTASSSRPTSGRSRQLASSDVSSSVVGPASSPQSRLSRVETPCDAVTTASSHSVQRETDRTVAEQSTNQADPSRHRSSVQSSVKASVTRASPPSVAASHDRPTASRLAVYETSSFCAVSNLTKNSHITRLFSYDPCRFWAHSKS